MEHLTNYLAIALMVVLSGTFGGSVVGVITETTALAAAGIGAASHLITVVIGTAVLWLIGNMVSNN